MVLFYPLTGQNQSLIVAVVVNFEQMYFLRRCIFLLILITSFTTYIYVEVVILMGSHPHMCTDVHMLSNINT